LLIEFDYGQNQLCMTVLFHPYMHGIVKVVPTLVDFFHCCVSIKQINMNSKIIVIAISPSMINNIQLLSFGGLVGAPKKVYMYIFH